MNDFVIGADAIRAMVKAMVNSRLGRISANTNTISRQKLEEMTNKALADLHDGGKKEI